MSLTGLLKIGHGPVWEWFAAHFSQTQRVSTHANRELRAGGTDAQCVVPLVPGADRGLVGTTVGYVLSAHLRADAIEAAAARGKPIMDEYVDRRGCRRRRPRRPLSAVSINKTITRLGQILEVAVERELIPRNAAKVGGKRRRLKAAKPARVYLDRAEQIAALLDAASKLDREARSNGRIARRALLATLTFAGLRISELLDLEWRDVDLAASRLRVRHSKTDAGSRYVDLLPVLRDELSTHKAASPNAAPSAYVFASAASTRQDGGRVRGRVLAKAVMRANAQLAAEGQTPLPEGLTLHALRRTCASVLVALGKDPRYVMAQLGHTDPTVTLGIYAQAMNSSDDDRERLRLLVEGSDLSVRSSQTGVRFAGM